MKWSDVLPAAECSYVLGNPPFVGSKFQTSQQRVELKRIVGEKVRGVGVLDYIAAWYFKAARYIQNTDIRVAFVSTNSISQGEQVGVLWGELLRLGINIDFAHRTFAWQSEARGAAHVHVVIIGFSDNPLPGRRIFDYQHIQGDPTEVAAKTINPYLVDAANVLVTNRSRPICDVPEIGIGNKPIDDGNYLFTDEEKESFVKLEPASAKWFRRWYGSREFINRCPRWCLWLGDCPPNELRAMPEAMKRIANVKAFRLSSKSEPTKKIAETPTRFHVESFPNAEYVVIPKVSSQRRNYIPIGFMSPPDLCSDLVFVMERGSLFHFGVLSSSMHMAWVRTVCGRLKSDYRYSAKLVYNNYPWPRDVTDRHREAVETAAQDVLSARDQFPNASLAELYDPLLMPAALTQGHAKLDRAVDRCYRSQPFASERNRIEFLFDLFVAYTEPLTSIRDQEAKRRAVRV